MSDHPKDETKPEEAQPNPTPDPAGPPAPVEKEDDVLRSLSIVGIVLVAGGGLLLPLMASTGSCQGATRSTKIQWEQRETEIRRAFAQDQAPRPPDNQPGGSVPGADDRGGK